MAVEVKYVVIREGEEKMSFTSKKEADAYDKMLDTADLLDTWLTILQCKWKTSNVKPFRYGWQNKKMC
ncbi:DNA damage-inducible protein YebG [Escherichia coli]|nr:DNA damage-inducible protein YebG [Escherichia coli]